MNIRNLLLAVIATLIAVPAFGQYTRHQFLKKNGVVIAVNDIRVTTVDTANSKNKILKSNGGDNPPSWVTADSLGALTLPVSVANGGTGGTTLATGQAGLGIVPFSIASDTTTTGQTLVGTGLQFAVGTSQTWEYHYFLNLSSSASSGVELGLTFPTGAMVKARVNGTTTGITAFSTDIISASATQTIAYNTVNAATGYAEIHGTIITDGSHSGNMVLDFDQKTSGTGKILAGSHGWSVRIR